MGTISFDPLKVLKTLNFSDAYTLCVIPTQSIEMVCTEVQIRKLMRLAKSHPLHVAAMKVGMSLSSAKRYVKLGGKRKPRKQAERTYRTREDPFSKVWIEVKTLLERDSGLEAKTIMDWLMVRYPGEFSAGQIRTLRRRIKDWRVLEGPERKDVFFAQTLRPGAQSQSDYTWCNSLKITIAGEPFPHLLYHFMLPYSRWEFVWICFVESYETLTIGYQKAVVQLGAVAAEHRTDNLAAAVPIGADRNIFQRRYMNFLAHFGVTPSANNPGCSNENGSVEKSHDLFKRAVDQRLRLDGTRDFKSVEDYEALLRSMISDRNNQRAERVKEEIACMLPLPKGAWDETREFSVSVNAFSTISINKAIYSVPSRFIGLKLRAQLNHERVKVFYGRHLCLRNAAQRARGERHQLSAHYFSPATKTESISKLSIQRRTFSATRFSSGVRCNGKSGPRKVRQGVPPNTASSRSGRRNDSRACIARNFSGRRNSKQ